MTNGGKAKPTHRRGEPGGPTTDILRLAKVCADAEPQYDPDDLKDLDKNGKPITRVVFCRRCTAVVLTDDGLEPSPLCHPCAQDAAHQLGVELLRVHQVIAALPPPLAASVQLAIQGKPEEGKAFIDKVLKATTVKVIHARLGRRKK